MGCKIVKKHVACLACLFGGFGLTVGDLIESSKDGLIDSSTIVEECAGNLLDTSDSELVKEGSDVVVGKLNALAIDRSSPGMRSMLRASRFFMADDIFFFQSSK